MKNTLIFLLLSLASMWSYSQSNSKNLLASCCAEVRGCNGSTYCTACKNCSGCKHCAKNGGSCGVCSGGTTRTYSSQKKSSNSSISRIYTSGNNITYVKGSLMYVSSTILNLREGPNVSYKILEKLEENAEVELLEISDSWLKVKVQKSKYMGYVYSKYLKVNKD